MLGARGQGVSELSPVRRRGARATDGSSRGVTADVFRTPKTYLVAGYPLPVSSWSPAPLSSLPLLRPSRLCMLAGPCSVGPLDPGLAGKGTCAMGKLLTRTHLVRNRELQDCPPRHKSNAGFCLLRNDATARPGQTTTKHGRVHLNRR